jgi:hypothetical protein
MKKVLIWLLVISFMSGFSFCLGEESVDVSRFLGTWICSEDTSNSGYRIETIHLAEGNRAFYLLQMFSSSEPTYSYKYVGHWEVEGHHAHIVFENALYDEFFAYILADGSMGMRLSDGAIGSHFMKPNSWGKLTVHESEAVPGNYLIGGASFPRGVYFVGFDILPGEYVIDAGDSVFVRVEIYNASSQIESFYLSCYNDKTYRVISLPENSQIAIGGGPAVISNLEDFLGMLGGY